MKGIVGRGLAMDMDQRSTYMKVRLSRWYRPLPPITPISTAECRVMIQSTSRGDGRPTVLGCHGQRMDGSCVLLWEFLGWCS